jgi:hypothetical protein
MRNELGETEKQKKLQELVPLFLTFITAITVDWIRAKAPSIPELVFWV